MACNNISTCAVVDFYDETRAERVINIGQGYSKISLVKTSKFFIATYPGSNSLALYFLEEMACARRTDKECDNADIQKATACYPNASIHPYRPECICSIRHYFDTEKLICLPCHDSCPFTCTGPGEDNCKKIWYYDKNKKTRYNYKCYDYPSEWYDVEAGVCKCFSGYKKPDSDMDHTDFCSKCPSPDCLSCDPTNPQICLNCQSGYALLDGKCFDCIKTSFDHDECPLSVSLSKWHDGKGDVPEDVFNIDERFIGLSWKINEKWDRTTDERYEKYWAPVLDSSGSYEDYQFFYDFLYVDLFHPEG